MSAQRTRRSGKKRIKTAVVVSSACSASPFAAMKLQFIELLTPCFETARIEFHSQQLGVLGEQFRASRQPDKPFV